MVFARKGTTAVIPMTSTLPTLAWCVGIFSEDAVLMEIVAGIEMLYVFTRSKFPIFMASYLQWL